MKEFVGLKYKMQAIKVGEKVTKESKGVKKSVVNNEMTFDEYKNGLISKIKEYTIMNLIRIYKHEIYTDMF